MYIIAQGGRGVIKLTGATEVIGIGGPMGYDICHTDASGQYRFLLGIYKTKEKAFEAMAGLAEAIEYGYRSFRMPEGD